MAHPFLAALERRVLLADGAMGTLLHDRGVPGSACLDEQNLTNPELVQAAHREYLTAGAEIIETNTFGANRLRLRSFGLAEKVPKKLADPNGRRKVVVLDTRRSRKRR